MNNSKNKLYSKIILISRPNPTYTKLGLKFQPRILDPTEAQNPKVPTQTSPVLG